VLDGIRWLIDHDRLNRKPPDRLAEPRLKVLQADRLVGAPEGKTASMPRLAPLPDHRLRHSVPDSGPASGTHFRGDV